MFQKIFLIAHGGAEAIFWILIFLSILSLASIIERFITLQKIKSKSEKALAQFRDLLQSNQLSDLNQLTQDKESLEGRALNYGLRHVKEHGTEGLSEVIKSFSLLERPKLEKSLSFLATVGNTSPFIGLLGTVFGIMKAFNDLGASQGDAASVMIGIAEALGATAVGLFVAIPAVIAYNYFLKQVKATSQGLQAVHELCVAYAKSKGK